MSALSADQIITFVAESYAVDRDALFDELGEPAVVALYFAQEYAGMSVRGLAEIAHMRRLRIAGALRGLRERWEVDTDLQGRLSSLDWAISERLPESEQSRLENDPALADESYAYWKAEGLPA